MAYDKRILRRVVRRVVRKTKKYGPAAVYAGKLAYDGLANRKKVKRTRSYTKTKKQKNGKVHQDKAGGGSYTWHQIGRRRPLSKKVKSTCQVINARQHLTQRVSTSVGRQSATSLSLKTWNPVNVNSITNNYVTGIKQWDVK